MEASSGSGGSMRRPDPHPRAGWPSTRLTSGGRAHRAAVAASGTGYDGIPARARSRSGTRGRRDALRDWRSTSSSCRARLAIETQAVLHFSARRRTDRRRGLDDAPVLREPRHGHRARLPPASQSVESLERPVRHESRQSRTVRPGRRRRPRSRERQSGGNAPGVPLARARPRIGAGPWALSPVSPRQALQVRGLKSSSVISSLLGDEPRNHREARRFTSSRSKTPRSADSTAARWYCFWTEPISK